MPVLTIDLFKPVCCLNYIQIPRGDTWQRMELEEHEYGKMVWLLIVLVFRNVDKKLPIFDCI